MPLLGYQAGMNFARVPNSRLPVFVSLWFMMIIGLAAVGPFNTYDSLTFPQRLGYWALIVTLSCVLDALLRYAYPVKTVLDLVLRRFLFVVGFSLCLYSINVLVFQYEHNFQAFSLAFGYVLIVSICIEAVLKSVQAIFGASHNRAQAHTSFEERREPSNSAFESLRRKLPESIRGSIWHLEARGHYLGILTDRGDAQILMRFSDAIVGLPHTIGVQTHRSHWVALDAAKRLLQAQGKYFVELNDETLVPVSKSRLKVVKAAVEQL